MTDGKSLTDPPKNLKEAIDWVISSKGNTQNLAAALEALLKEDADGVAWEVRDVFDVIENNINKKCDKMNGPFCDHYKGHLRSATEGLKDVKRPDKATSGNLKAAMDKLAEGLKKFLGHTGSSNFSGSGIISNVSSGYTFTYNNAEWDPADAPKCAAIFLGILPAIFFGVTLIYWKCSEKNGWHNSKLENDNYVSPLKQFLTQMCFNGVKFNESISGKSLVSSILNTEFSNELETAKAESNDYPEFLGQLQKALESKPPNPSIPLTSLYLLSYYYITYPLHEVQSSNPVTPSFLGYSGPAALAGGAYGFNLGGINTFMSALLA
ncbi:variant erythrocyte surface antigen-1 family protein [Babesia caballi]|uniref:Variant erythrocyte surface antigen-1 family protein n=1 Tax=Babesia caballi TaxID=5871 RepID=A0AAV4LUS1_BABCB|nr:variant erythrocyte surface antigen-1 family protein [Babesia caballi]